MNGEGHEIRPVEYQGEKTPAKQCFDTIDGDGLSGEQRLMLAVLIDAINVLKGRVPTGGFSKRQAFAEAAHWVAQTGTHYPFTFESVCNALDLPVELLRERLTKLARARGHSSTMPENRLRRLPTGRASSIRFSGSNGPTAARIGR